MLKVMTVQDLAHDPAALLARVAAGDRAAFAVLARDLYPSALRIASRVLLDRAEAEDAVQTALTKLWAGADRFDPARGAFMPWFRRLLVNCCLDRRRTVRAVAPIEAAAHVAESGDDPHAAAERRSDAARVNAAVAQLLPRQRAAIALFYGDGATMAEIAEILETTPKAVEGLLGRARIELKALLAAPAAPELRS